MEKTLIGWTVIVPGHLSDIRTYYRVGQKEAMLREVSDRIEMNHKFTVEPEFGTPRKVLY